MVISIIISIFTYNITTMSKTYNDNIYIPTHRERNETMRVGIQNHLTQRLKERFNTNDIISIFEECWVYNPQTDKLPNGLTNECIKGISGKSEKYGYEHIFYINDRYNCIIVIRKNDDRWKNYKTFKPWYWCDYSVYTIWECFNGIWIDDEPTDNRETIKVGNQYYKI